jgi:hypothetical protein
MPKMPKIKGREHLCCNNRACKGPPESAAKNQIDLILSTIGIIGIIGIYKFYLRITGIIGIYKFSSYTHHLLHQGEGGLDPFEG